MRRRGCAPCSAAPASFSAGIFASPGLVLLHTKSAGMAIIAWIVAGFIALLGGCTYAELGTAIPESGGEYVYIRRCFGHLPAFLFSWTSNIVLKPGSLALLPRLDAGHVAAERSAGLWPGDSHGCRTGSGGALHRHVHQCARCEAGRDHPQVAGLCQGVRAGAMAADAGRWD